MTGNAIHANSESLDPRDLSSEDLDAVSGGFLGRIIRQMVGGQNDGQTDSAQMFQQILQQLTGQ